MWPEGTALDRPGLLLFWPQVRLFVQDECRGDSPSPDRPHYLGVQGQLSLKRAHSYSLTKKQSIQTRQTNIFLHMKIILSECI